MHGRLALMGKGSRVCKKTAGHCCAKRISKQVSASSDKVIFKRPVAALASGSQLVVKRPATVSASGEQAICKKPSLCEDICVSKSRGHVRCASKRRVQFHGERVNCAPEKYDELAQALKALRSSKLHWLKKAWSNAVEREIGCAIGARKVMAVIDMDVVKHQQQGQCPLRKHQPMAMICTKQHRHVM